ncbi:MAG: cytochrome c [Chloroflexota bacterium]|nr:cytochrome c [Chloroflexota bacterium]
MKRASALFLFLIVALLSACGRSAAEVQTVLDQQATAGAATRAAMPTVTTSIVESTTEGGVAVAATGDVARGEQLFNTPYQTASGQWICANCHSTGENRLIGPGMGGLAARAATRVEGQDAATYIANSILHPNDFIVPADAGGPYPQDLMPQNYSEILSEQDVQDLVAYLSSLN